MNDNDPTTPRDDSRADDLETQRLSRPQRLTTLEEQRLRAERRRVIDDLVKGARL